MLVILTPQAMTDPTQIAEQLKPLAKQEGKPVLASWMGGVDVAAGEEILNRANIPTFPYPDTAARAFNYMWRYSYNLQGLYETPALPEDSADWTPDRKLVEEIIQTAPRRRPHHPDRVRIQAGAERLRHPHGPDHHRRRCRRRRRRPPTEIGYPGGAQAVLGNHHPQDRCRRRAVEPGQTPRPWNGPSPPSRHRSPRRPAREHFQGVTVQPMIKLKDAYELIVGSSLDPQFGPVLLFGTGGQLVEVFKDRALALPPLNTTLARRMMEQTKIYKALKGVRGRKPVDLAALEMLLVRFSALVAEQRWIKEIDINPLLASPDGLIALDARVVVHGPEVAVRRRSPRPPSAPIPRATWRPGP